MNIKSICPKGAIFFTVLFLLSTFTLEAQHRKLLNVKVSGDKNFTNRKILKIEKLASRNELNQTLKIWLADAYLQNNRYDSALPLLEDIALYKNIAPEYPYKLAQTYLFLGQSEKAITQLTVCGDVGLEQMRILTGEKYIEPQNVAINPLSLVNTIEDEISQGFYYNRIVFTSAKSKRIRILNKNDIYFSSLMGKGLIPDKVYPYDGNRMFKDDFSLSSIDGFSVINTRNERRFFSIYKPTKALYFKTEGSRKSRAFNFNSQNYDIVDPFLTDDGNTLFFSSNMMGGKGGYDIYVSYKFPNGWSYPKNLGNKINTSGDELFPCFVDSTLYFSSNGLPGFGNMDVFYSTMDGKEFSEPINMGTPINSSNNDVGFYINSLKNRAILSSDRSQGMGGKDLYILRFD